MLSTVSPSFSGCGGGLVGREFRNEHTQYRIGALPASWQSVGEGGDLAWQDKNSGSVIQLNSSCDPRHDIPLKALTGHLLIGFSDRNYLEEKTVSLDQREALFTRVNAKLDGVERFLSVYVLKKNACVYDFVMAADSKDSHRLHISDFQRFVEDFHTLR